MSWFYHFARRACIIFCFIWFRIEVNGLENLPKEGGFIVVANHQSYFDPITVGMKIKRQLRFMAKEELFQNRLFGFLIRSLGAFEVKRGVGDVSAVEQAVDTVKNGGGLLLFPEGTRSKSGEIMRFKSGAIVIAAQTGADIIPSAVYMSNGKKFRSKLIVNYGKPITNEELALDTGNPRTIKAASRKLHGEVCALHAAAKGRVG